MTGKDKEKEENDITSQLLDEAIEQTKKEKEVKEKELKEAAAKKQSVPEKEKKKNENIASETPQDRFRRIVRDQGYHVGIENMTAVFFEGNTDSPAWLDDVLKLSHIPSKSREMILTAYYGKTIKELGIVVELGFGSKANEEKKVEEAKKAAGEDEFDVLKLSQDEMRETIKNEKTLLSIAQLKKMRKQLEHDDTDKKSDTQQQQQYQMRQVIRPVIRDGKMIYGKDGVVVTETVVEPVALGQQGGTNDLVNMLIMKSLAPQEAQKTTTSDPALLEYIKKLDSKIEGMETARQIQAKEEEIKRMNDKLERKEEEYKKDAERKEKDYNDRLDKMNAERIRDLTELKERFAETIQHKKELDDVVGQISSQHKKEIDGFKQKLEHTQTNIERTVVSKGTETIDKMTQKVGDIAEDVIKPLANVMQDHYKTMIDQTRVNAGLPSLRDTIPKVNESELEKFARE